MLHYFSAKGSKLTINLEGMIEDSPTAKAHFTHEVSQAQKFVEKLTVGTHNITSKTAEESAYNYKSETKNWFYAVGGYSTWGKGVATVNNDASGKLLKIIIFLLFCISCVACTDEQIGLDVSEEISVDKKAQLELATVLGLPENIDVIYSHAIKGSDQLTKLIKHK